MITWLGFHKHQSRSIANKEFAPLCTKISVVVVALAARMSPRPLRADIEQSVQVSSHDAVGTRVDADSDTVMGPPMPSEASRETRDMYDRGLDRKLAIQARRASEGIVECRYASLACASGLYEFTASISQAYDQGLRPVQPRYPIRPL